MKRRKRIERRGYKVTRVIGSNNVIATKGNTRFVGMSISDLHKQIFGY